MKLYFFAVFRYSSLCHWNNPLFIDHWLNGPLIESNIVCIVFNTINQITSSICATSAYTLTYIYSVDICMPFTNSHLFNNSKFLDYISSALCYWIFCTAGRLQWLICHVRRDLLGKNKRFLILTRPWCSDTPLRFATDTYFYRP